MYYFYVCIKRLYYITKKKNESELIYVIPMINR